MSSMVSVNIAFVLMVCSILSVYQFRSPLYSSQTHHPHDEKFFPIYYSYPCLNNPVENSTLMLPPPHHIYIYHASFVFWEVKANILVKSIRYLFFFFSRFFFLDICTTLSWTIPTPSVYRFG
ncbi:hypothetical protein DFH27DRAFT_543096 [Peziza echinospora]|nr:hypothetical protein DFH27DRAFT_543096 [Peziza echinospora]